MANIWVLLLFLVLAAGVVAAIFIVSYPEIRRQSFCSNYCTEDYCNMTEWATKEDVMYCLTNFTKGRE